MATNTQIKVTNATVLGLNSTKSYLKPKTYEEKQALIKRINSEFYGNTSEEFSEQSNINDDMTVLHSKLIEIIDNQHSMMNIFKILNTSLATRLHEVEEKCSKLEQYNEQAKTSAKGVDAQSRVTQNYINRVIEQNRYNAVCEPNVMRRTIPLNDAPDGIFGSKPTYTFPEFVSIEQARSHLPLLQKMGAKEDKAIIDPESFSVHLRAVNSAVCKGDQAQLALAWNKLMHTINGNTFPLAASSSIVFTFAAVFGYSATAQINNVLFAIPFAMQGQFTRADFYVTAVLNGNGIPAADAQWEIDAWVSPDAIPPTRPMGMTSGSINTSTTLFMCPQLKMTEPVDTSNRTPALTFVGSASLAKFDFLANGNDWNFVPVFGHISLNAMSVVSTKTLTVRYQVRLSPESSYIGPTIYADFPVFIDGQSADVSVNVNASTVLPVSLTASSITLNTSTVASVPISVTTSSPIDVNVLQIDPTLLPLPVAVSGVVPVGPSPLPVTLIGAIGNQPRPAILNPFEGNSNHAPPRYKEGGYNPYGNGQMQLLDDFVEEELEDPIAKCLQYAEMGLDPVAENAKVCLYQLELKAKLKKEEEDPSPITEKTSAAAKREEKKEVTVEPATKQEEASNVDKRRSITQDSPWYNPYCLLMEILADDAYIDEEFSYDDEDDDECSEQAATLREEEARENTGRNQGQSKPGTKPQTQQVRNDDASQAKDEAKNALQKANQRREVIKRIASGISQPAQLMTYILRRARYGKVVQIPFLRQLALYLAKSANERLPSALFTIIGNVTNLKQLAIIMNSWTQLHMTVSWSEALSVEIRNENFDKILSYLWDEILEGSFNPYGNGQNDPKIEDFLLARNSAERELYALLSPDGKLTRLESDEMIAQLSRDVSKMDLLLTELINIPQMSAYIGPNYTGGTMGSSQTLHDLAERFVLKPVSRLDDLARMHDMIYSTTADPVKIRNADEGLIASIAAITDRTVQEDATLHAFKAKIIAEDAFTKYLNANSGTKLMIGSFNPYGNGQTSIKIDAVRQELKDWFSSEAPFVRTSPFGVAPMGYSNTNNLFDPTTHDAYLQNRRRDVTRTVPNLQVQEFAPLDGYTGWARDIRVAGAIIAGAEPELTTSIGFKIGQGPALVPTAISEDFGDYRLGMAKLLAALRTNVAVYLGNVLYVFYALTSIPKTGDGKMSMTGGSNGYILSNIWNYQIQFDCNTIFIPVHNLVNTYMVKIQDSNPGALARLPYHGNVNIMLWAATVTQMAQYLAGKPPIAGSAHANFRDPPIIVAITNRMAASPDTVPTNLYIAAHCPYPLFANTPRLTMKDVTAGGVLGSNADGVGRSRLGKSKTIWNSAVNGQLNILLVLIDGNAVQGAMGQPAADWDIDLSVPGQTPLQTVDSIANNYFTVNAIVPIIPRNGNVLFLETFTALRDAPSNGAYAQAQDDWELLMGDDYCYRTAMMQTLLMHTCFAKQPYISTDQRVAGIQSGFNSFTYGNTVAATPATAASYNANFSNELTDAFGQDLLRDDTLTPHYRVACMHWGPRLALALGVYATQGLVKKSRSPPSSMGAGIMFYEQATLLRTLVDETFLTFGTTSNALNGRMYLATPPNTYPALVRRIVKTIMTDLNMANAFTCDPLSQTEATRRTDALYCRGVFTNTFMGTQFDKGITGTMYKDAPFTEAKSGALQLASLDIPGGQASFASYYKVAKTMSQQDFYDWFAPLPQFTSISTPPLGNLFVGRQESDTINVIPIYLNVQMATTSIWLTPYLGTTAQFAAANFGGGNYNFRVLNTTQPLLGPQFNLPMNIVVGQVGVNIMTKQNPMWMSWAYEATGSVGFAVPTLHSNPFITAFLSEGKSTAEAVDSTK